MFTDSFDDLSNWDAISGSPSVSGGQLILPISGNTYSEIHSKERYDLIGGTASIRYVDLGSPTTGFNEREIEFYLVGTAGITQYSAGISVHSGEAGGRIFVRTYINGVSTIPYNEAWSLSTHRYSRFRDDGATLYFERSPDGYTWTTMYSRASIPQLASALVHLDAGNWGPGETNTIILDDFRFVPASDWSYKGAVGATQGGSGNYTPSELPGAAEGDLIIFSIGARAGETPTLSSDWTLLGYSPVASNSDENLTSGIGQVFTWYCVRGASAPNYLVTRGSGPNINQYWIAYFAGVAGKELDVVGVSSNTLASPGTVPSTPSITTTQNDVLLYAIASPGRSASVTQFRSATDPLAASGTTSTSYIGTLTSDVWERRGNLNTTQGFDMSLAQGVAVKAAAGDTGEFRATSASSSRAGMLAAAFQWIPVDTGNATADGQTVTTTASAVPGGASGGASRAGVTVSIAAAVTAGSATGAAPAAGATVTTTASVIAGAASTAASVSGPTISTTLSVIAGTASSAGSTTVPGRTVVVTSGQVPGAASAVNPISAFVDTFGSLDEALWVFTPGVSGDIAINAGRLAMTQTTTAYSAARSVNRYRLTASQIQVYIDPGPITGLAGREAIIEVRNPAAPTTNKYGIIISGSGSMAAFRNEGATGFNGFGYTTVTGPLWVRIREDGGTVYFERSTNGITYTAFTTRAAAWSTDVVEVELSAGRYAAETPQTVFFDNVGGVPVVANGATVVTTASVVAGAASAVQANTASGVTVTTTVSVIAGSASSGALPDPARVHIQDTAGDVIVDTSGGFIVEPATDGTGSGAIVVATASVLPGVAGGFDGSGVFIVEPGGDGALLDTSNAAIKEPATDATAPGPTVTVVASVLAGSPSSIDPGVHLVDPADGYIVDTGGDYIVEAVSATTTSGETVTATLSVLAGAASGSAGAQGPTTTTTASVVSGAASGGQSAQGPGATVAVVSSVVQGTAFGGASDIASGTIVQVDAALVRGTASGDAAAAGVIVAATASVVAGTTQTGSGASAAGATITLTASSLPGSALVASEGVTVQVQAQVVSGTATGSGNTPGTVAVVSASLIAGTASGRSIQFNPASVLIGI